MDLNYTARDSRVDDVPTLCESAVQGYGGGGAYLIFGRHWYTCVQAAKMREHVFFSPKVGELPSSFPE